MLNYILIVLPLLLIIGIVFAVKRQSNVTHTASPEENEKDARAFDASAKRMEATIAEELAKKARDPRLASMTQEDLVFEVLKECYDPEIPLNIVDLGLVYDVKVLPDGVNIQIVQG